MNDMSLVILTGLIGQPAGVDRHASSILLRDSYPRHPGQVFDDFGEAHVSGERPDVRARISPAPVQL